MRWGLSFLISLHKSWGLFASFSCEYKCVNLYDWVLTSASIFYVKFIHLHNGTSCTKNKDQQVIRNFPLSKLARKYGVEKNTARGNSKNMCQVIHSNYYLFQFLTVPSHRNLFWLLMNQTTKLYRTTISFTCSSFELFSCNLYVESQWT